MKLQLAVPTGSLDSYIQGANHIPILSAEDEMDLALRFRDENDLEAAKQLVLSHLRFVVRVARGYNGYGLQLSDLIQEGNIGLMKAVKRYNPDFGVRLVSFAVHWIRAEMHEYILRNWRIVKVATTKAQRKLFYNLRSAKKRLGWMNRNEACAIAKDLGVPIKDVLEMEKRLSARDESFDAPVNDDDETTFSPAGYLENNSPSPELNLLNQEQEASSQENLVNALETLDERSQAIIRKRWLCEQKSTLHELGDEFGVSAERIRQLEENAMKKMRTAISV